MQNAPSAYLDGYARAQAVDREIADSYIRHTTIGDPELDPVMEELAKLPPPDMHRFIRAGVEQDDEATELRCRTGLISRNSNQARTLRATVNSGASS